MNDASNPLSFKPVPAPAPAPDADAFAPDGGRSGDVYLVVRGRGGLLDGEIVKVALGATATLGRGRRCDISLKKSARYLLSAGGDRALIRARLAYRSVSRRHCSVKFVSPEVVEIENHSPNGTLVDGRPVTCVRLDDIQRMAHELRLGRNGDLFDLEYGSLAMMPEDSISR